MSFAFARKKPLRDDIWDSLNIGFDKQDGYASICVVRRTDDGNTHLLVDLQGERAEELYKYLTDQQYALENIPRGKGDS